MKTTIKNIWKKFIFGPSWLALYIRSRIPDFWAKNEKPEFLPMRRRLMLITRRTDDWSYEVYHQLRKTDNTLLKQRLSGEPFYQSFFAFGKNGKRMPYVRSVPNDYERKRAERQLHRQARDAAAIPAV